MKAICMLETCMIKTRTIEPCMIATCMIDTCMVSMQHSVPSTIPHDIERSPRQNNVSKARLLFFTDKSHDRTRQETDARNSRATELHKKEANWRITSYIKFYTFIQDIAIVPL